jgi:phosphatidylserine/phosphatidylglycerophosphate/cardiolipin synthase-like enzyme
MKNLFLIILLIPFAGFGQNKIKVYSTQPVDTSVSTGVNAIYLNRSYDDTLIAYIQRAKYTIDIAVFSYDQYGQMSNIANAVNSAKANGIRIRWIYCGGVGNTGVSLLNSLIPTLASPTSSLYAIMHHKFVIFDVNSPDPDDAIVFTGSANWNPDQINEDENNLVIINDQPIAQVYLEEFNEMWGDTGMVPNASTSRFGPFKTNNTQHYFQVEGKTVEVYFSPSDNTNSHLINVINSADNDINFGVYTFTRPDIADTIVYKINQGVTTTGIMDQYSIGFNAQTILSPVMGNNLKIFTHPDSLFHSKYMIVDACDPNSDPVVEVGTHNWTTAAETKNDENVLIIHDDTIANIFLQAYKGSFNRLNGILPACIPNSVEEVSNVISIYPNPVSNYLELDLPLMEIESLIIYSIDGREMQYAKIENGRIDVSRIHTGIYMMKITTSQSKYVARFVKID